MTAGKNLYKIRPRIARETLKITFGAISGQIVGFPQSYKNNWKKKLEECLSEFPTIEICFSIFF